MSDMDSCLYINCTKVGLNNAVVRRQLAEDCHEFMTRQAESGRSCTIEQMAWKFMVNGRGPAYFARGRYSWADLVNRPLILYAIEQVMWIYHDSGPMQWPHDKNGFVSWQTTNHCTKRHGIGPRGVAPVPATTPGPENRNWMNHAPVHVEDPVQAPAGDNRGVELIPRSPPAVVPTGFVHGNMPRTFEPQAPQAGPGQTPRQGVNNAEQQPGETRGMLAVWVFYFRSFGRLSP